MNPAMSKLPQSEKLADTVQVGDQIQVLWKNDGEYHPGIVTASMPCGRHTIFYLAHEFHEDVLLREEQWYFIGTPSEHLVNSQTVPSSPRQVNAPAPRARRNKRTAQESESSEEVEAQPRRKRTVKRMPGRPRGRSTRSGSEDATPLRKPLRSSIKRGGEFVSPEISTAALHTRSRKIRRLSSKNANNHKRTSFQEPNGLLSVGTPIQGIEIDVAATPASNELMVHESPRFMHSHDTPDSAVARPHVPPSENSLGMMTDTMLDKNSPTNASLPTNAEQTTNKRSQFVTGCNGHEAEPCGRSVGRYSILPNTNSNKPTTTRNDTTRSHKETFISTIGRKTFSKPENARSSRPRETDRIRSKSLTITGNKTDVTESLPPSRHGSTGVTPNDGREIVVDIPVPRRLKSVPLPNRGPENLPVSHSMPYTQGQSLNNFRSVMRDELDHKKSASYKDAPNMRLTKEVVREVLPKSRKKRTRTPSFHNAKTSGAAAALKPVVGVALKTMSGSQSHGSQLREETVHRHLHTDDEERVGAPEAKQTPKSESNNNESRKIANEDLKVDGNVERRMRQTNLGPLITDEGEYHKSNSAQPISWKPTAKQSRTVTPQSRVAANIPTKDGTDADGTNRTSSARVFTKATEPMEGHSRQLARRSKKQESGRHTAGSAAPISMAAKARVEDTVEDVVGPSAHPFLHQLGQASEHPRYPHPTLQATHHPKLSHQNYGAGSIRTHATPMPVPTSQNRTNYKVTMDPKLLSVIVRIEKEAAEIDMNLRRHLGQFDRQRQNIESLQGKLQGMQEKIANLPTTSEVKSLLEAQTCEGKRMTEESLRSIVTEFRNEMKDIMSVGMRNSMETIATEIRRSNAYLISRAVDIGLSLPLPGEDRPDE